MHFVRMRSEHVLRNWYSGTEYKVRMEGHCSESFRMERGVRQGSVLSLAMPDVQNFYHKALAVIFAKV